jgi:hypothetical protein
MSTALDSSFDLGGMKHTATASKLFVRLVSMGLALRFTTIYHENIRAKNVFTMEKIICWKCLLS